MSESELAPPQPVANLYKYMGYDLGHIVLENRTLRWSTPGTLNDPYDMQFGLRIEIDPADVKARALEKLWEQHYGEAALPAGNKLGSFIKAVRGIFPRLSREEFDQEIGEAIDQTLGQMKHSLPPLLEATREILTSSKILCLSSNPTSNLMWAHYAASHQGIALRFRDAPDLDSPWKMARPINYLADIPVLINGDFLSDFLAGRDELKPRPFLDRLIYTKSADWSYEHEWRIWSGSGRNPEAAFEDVRFHPLELDGVILGYRMPQDKRHATIALVRRLYPHAEILHVVPSERQFQLAIEPLLSE
ncbi:DUF2971 domain-containing protein [Microvirga arabica]|uniref:DUF2971 domain-containing protein n=1 Tax=Microvirga arabica TaxID=1128671 RepID=UPI00193A3096|nr:DUF2971 domain-containing protein [Microvirga arabica]MBM1173487.1 DUF2971 domain-containing protein [Microvirga arabica]